MTHELTSEQLERLAALDAAHRIAAGDENLDATAIVDMAIYVATGRRPPWPPMYYTGGTGELHAATSVTPLPTWPPAGREQRG